MRTHSETVRSCKLKWNATSLYRPSFACGLGGNDSRVFVLFSGEMLVLCLGVSMGYSLRYVVVQVSLRSIFSGVPLLGFYAQYMSNLGAFFSSLINGTVDNFSSKTILN